MRKIFLFVALLFSVSAFAQKADPNDPTNAEKGKQLIQQVIEARGGASFLGYKTIQSTGHWTPFEQGLSTVPIPFLDYIIFPDKERTEFGKAKKKKDRKIQVNVGNGGWYYDGEAETLKEQDEKKLREFQEGLDTDIDRILRGGWQQKGVEVSFYGREETRPGDRADVVTIKFKSEFTVYLMIDRYTHLPMTLSYEKPGGEKGTEKYEYRYNQYVAYDGVKFPNIVDLYRDRIQISRVNYESIKLNVQIPETIFVKPPSAKEVK